MSGAGGWGGPGGDGTHLLQEIPDATGILGAEDVPQGTGLAAGIPEPLLQRRIQALGIGLQEHVWGAEGCSGGAGRGPGVWGPPHTHAPTLPCRAAACTRTLMESVASTVRFLVPMVRSWGCTPASGSGAVGEHQHGWGEPSTPPTHTLGTVALTISHADTWAQPALGPLAPQVGGQVEATNGPAVLRQRQAGAQVGGPVAQAQSSMP